MRFGDINLHTYLGQAVCIEDVFFVESVFDGDECCHARQAFRGFEMFDK